MDEYGASPTMRILMVAGGTGGHIFPALAVAEELRARGELAVAITRSNSWARTARSKRN